MAYFGAFKYGAEKYGVGVTTGNLLWSFVVLWDGVWWSPNEAHGRMVDLTVNRGRQSLLASGGKGLESFGIGEATAILDNEDGRFDPFDTTSPLYPHVTPGKFVRIAVRDDNTDTDYGVMRGVIDDIQPVKRGDREAVRIVVKDGLQWLKDRIINLGLQQTISKHSVFDLVYAAASWPTTEWPITRTTDTDTHDYWWGWNQSAYKAMKEFDKAEWAVTFHDRDGNLTWRPSEYTQERTTDIGQDEILKDIGRPQPWEVVRNIARVYASPKILNEGPHTLWELQTIPAILDTEVFFIECIFKYQEWLPCGESIVFNHTVNAEAGGGGADLTGDCPLTYDTQIGEGARITITNNSGSDGFIIALNTTGNAIYAPDVDIREEEDTISQAAYGDRTLVVDSRWIEDQTEAETQAEWLLANLKDPSVLPIIQMEDRLVNQFTPDLYDKLILRVPKKSIRQVYRVGSLGHQWLNENGQSIRTSMRLEPYLIQGVVTSNAYHNGCLLSASAPTTIADDTLTLLSWDTNLITSDYHTAGTTIVIPAGLTGYHRIWGSIQWEGNTVGKRSIRLYNAVGGATKPEFTLSQSDGLGTTSYTQHMAITRYLEAGDLIRLYVYQNSTGNLDVEHDSTPYSPLFGITFLGA